ncbi:sulfotransferase [Parvularcula lutaonensis]|uniref:Sulfotransferase n=1 Tax=Parvularcula lutaonensis TaxID=491923 RepID=A0ABV7M892_9PROT|nr:sulfotransferase [Parvularcula lutaonensis]GGY56918.1 hypothetical protein GCM10007148_28040 [Parvularcula lutaonensis]
MSATEYSLLDRWFHRLTLAGNAAPSALFDVEKTLFGKDLPDVTSGHHVFVAGLARAGTTLLMRTLYETGAFASLTYRDMPLVTAPNLWQRLSGRAQKEGEEAERAHGDGMLVDFDSPEALEEVFWRSQVRPSYIGGEALRPVTVSGETISDFRVYVALILRRYGRQRYLAKNNNAILRLPVIAAAFPEATILVPFRDPVAQARSLLTQHRRFLETHAADRFSRDYMGWLAHHEFGSDHRPFVFSATAPPPPTDEAESLDYWLARWNEAYRFLLSQAEGLPGRVRFFSYERFTDDPGGVRDRLFDLLGLLAPSQPMEVRKPAPVVVDGSPPHLPAAQATYAELNDRAL